MVGLGFGENVQFHFVVGTSLPLLMHNGGFIHWIGGPNGSWTTTSQLASYIFSLLLTMCNPLICI